MRVSVIIPLLNRWDLTEKCLASLDADCCEHEIVLVDNGSTDQTARQDVAVRNPRNQGFAKACNQGARAASGDVLVFLNNDTEVTPDWLEPLLEHPLCGPKLVYPSGGIQCAGVSVDFSRRFGEEAVNVQTDRTAGPVDALTGACLAISAELFRDLGGFDAGYWNGYEDVDLCLKARAAGVTPWYCPESVVVHHESQSDRGERFRKAHDNIARLRQKWT